MKILPGAASSPSRHVQREARPSWNLSGDLLDSLPVAIYMCDREGLIVGYNARAADLWGRAAKLNDSTDRFCGSHRLYEIDGTPLPREKCAMADTLRSGQAVRDRDILIERSDGTRVPVRAHISAIRNSKGHLIGAVSVLADVSSHSERDETGSDLSASFLASIVASSDDAILTKDLNGIITSWNAGATRVFGYTENEMIGQPVLRLIPTDRHDEEAEILTRIRRGERIEHYETIRQRKDGTFIDISLTVSPVKNRAGQTVGASKIARDITERRRAERQNELLIREMDHRAKNLFALASGLVTLSARTAQSTDDLAEAVRERLGALASAHALTLPRARGDGLSQPETSLHALFETIAAPYDKSGSRVKISGRDVPVSGTMVTPLALLLHEFTTNAAKYGALSTATGHVAFDSELRGDELVLTWTERGGPAVERCPQSEGFGTLLARTTVRDQLKGEIAYIWEKEGLTIKLKAMQARLTP